MRDQQGENDRLRRECEDLREVLNTKISAIERDYIKINKHEAILNEEISQAN